MPNDSGLVMVHNSLAPAAEAFRVLRINLQFASIDRDLRVVQVTSSITGEGKSVTAANFSAALARDGKRVVLIDADLRKPTQHKLFKLVNTYGVTSALLGNLDSVDQLLHETSIPNLSVLTSGPLPPNPSELLGSQRMQELLQTLAQQVDVIVLDSAPVTVVSDSAVIASYVDGVLLVVKAGSTRADMVKNAVEALQQVEAQILGVVLNAVKANESGFFYKYDQRYGHIYGHNQADEHSSRRFGIRRRKRKQPTTVDAPSARIMGQQNGVGMVQVGSNGTTASEQNVPS